MNSGITHILNYAIHWPRPNDPVVHLGGLTCLTGMAKGCLCIWRFWLVQELTAAVRKARFTFETNLANNVKHNPSLFWKYVR